MPYEFKCLIPFIFALSSLSAWADATFPDTLPLDKQSTEANGYYDRNLTWHEVNPPQNRAYYERLSPRPMAFYIANARAGEDTSYLSGLSEGSRTRIRDIVAIPDMRSAVSIARGSDGEWHYSYQLSSTLSVAVPDGQFPLDRFTLKSAILGLRPASFPARDRSLITSLQSQVNASGFNNLLLREWSCEQRIPNPADRQPGNNCTPAEESEIYSAERFKYYLRGFKHQISQHQNPPNYHSTTPPLRVTPCRSGASAPNYQFSIAPFKKGDLDSMCKQQVDRGVASGFQKITLFMPIHYSGGNTPENPYGAHTRDMRAGWDYHYDDADGIGEAELHRCLAYINSAGLQLNYVPHAESIVTMNSHGESEWRIHSSLPINNEYYNRAYGPLLHYMQAHPDQARGQNIRVAAAAELDPSFIGNTRASLNMMRRLRREMTATGAVPEISWMPNGDFHNGWHPIATNHLDCSAMAELMGEVDRISPSLYQEYGHIYNSRGMPETRGSDVSFTATREHFFANMTTKFRSLCPSQASNLSRIARSRKFSLGEFALTGGSYSDFSAQMRAAGGSDTDATFWNSGGWDHAGISRPTTSAAHQTEIATTTSPCGSAGATLTPAAPAATCPSSAEAALPVSTGPDAMGDIRREIDP